MSHSFQYHRRFASELFHDKNLYRIPDYQRGFAWRIEDIEGFWTDIEDSMSQNLEQYFLGTIVLIPRKDGFDIVDGQQRIATLTLLFKIMLDVLDDYEEEDEDVEFLKPKIRARLFHQPDRKTSISRLKMNKNDQLYYSKYLMRSDTEEEVRREKAEKDSEKRLLRAYIYLRNKVQAVLHEGGPSSLLLYYNYLASNVLVISIEAGDDSDAFHIFESINAKGVPFSPLDLLKNLLISRSKRANRSDAVRFWDNLSEKFSEAQAFRFVRYYWMAKYELLRKKGFYRKVKAKVKSSLKPEDLIQELKEYSKIYQVILNPNSSKNHKIKKALSGLRTLTVTQVHPILLAAGNRYGITSNEFGDVADALLSFVVRKFIVGKANPNEFEKESGEIARSIGEKELDANGLRTRLRREAPKDDKFKSEFSELIIHRKNVAKYLLKQINHSYSKTKEMEVVGTVHLEHILPQKATEQWLKMFDDAQEEFLANWTQRLGNMTLLDNSLNKSIKNSSLKIKQKSYKKSAIKITKDLCRYTNWDYVDIEERQKKFANRAAKI
ncbi:MAG: DUF262 domain-containing protein [Candidatus Thorarchaeota archaeon]